MKKVCCFSTSFFSRFGVDLGGSGGPKCNPNGSLGILLGGLEWLFRRLGNDFYALELYWALLDVLGARWGYFGELFGQICRRFGLDLWSISEKIGTSSASNASTAFKPVECSSHSWFDQTHPKLLSVSADLSALECHRPTKQIQNFCHFMQTLVHENAIIQQTKSKTSARNLCQFVHTWAPENAVAQQSTSKTSAISCKRWCMKTPSSNEANSKLLPVCADVSAWKRHRRWISTGAR